MGEKKRISTENKVFKIKAVENSLYYIYINYIVHFLIFNKIFRI